MVSELVAGGYKGSGLLAEVVRLTGLDPHNAAILIGLETGQGPFGDTEPPVSSTPKIPELLDRFVVGRMERPGWDRPARNESGV